MDTTLIKLSSNWTQIGGCNFLQALQLQNADPDVFNRPTLDDLVDQDKAVLLSKDKSSENCELLIKLYPHYKIQAISLVCNANKVEIFQGHVKEYLETVYGTIVDDCEDDVFKTYRYDVEVEKSGITELVIKFPSQSTEICLFGIMLQTAPNPNGITTLIPHASAINMENVKGLLKNSSISTASEKCKKLLELMEKSKPLPSHISPPSCNIAALTKSVPSLHQPMPTAQCNIKPKQNMDVDLQETPEGLTSLKKYIDERFSQLEERLNQRLSHMEQRQIENVDRILKVFEEFNRKTVE